MVGIALVSFVASPFINQVVNKLGSLFFEELGTVSGLRSDAEKLQSVLQTILLVLDDAENRSINDKALRGWLIKLKDAALDADDVVDELQTEALRRRLQRRNLGFRKVSSLLPSPVHQYKMAHKIKAVRARLDEIAEEKRNYLLLNEGSVPQRATDERNTYSGVDQSEVIGRTEDKEKVVNFLLNNEKALSILPIVGLGGIGKTTLAQLVYNDERVIEKFNRRYWVCVSENYSISGIVRSMIQCTTNSQCDLSNLQALYLQLQASLRWEKYLLILDDVWNEKEAEWEKLKDLLKCGKDGSKIIATTRSKQVARIMGTVSMHNMPLLSSDDCWLLFKKRAFRSIREEDNPALVEIGKVIVNKCGGLPLAAKAVGSLMGSKIEEEEWLAISESNIWTAQEENSVLPALMLSYNNLPSHLKPCFAYCSLFPKGYPIEREKLIQLWIAEGFVMTNNSNMTAVEGNQYFNSLVWRSFFEVAEKDVSNNIISFKMHDLVHELACSIAKDESLRVEVDMKSVVSSGCRYSSVVYDDHVEKLPPDVLYPAKKLRSFILIIKQWFAYVNDDKCMDFISNIISTQSHLRALGLDGAKINVLPSRISRLKHLRYLDLSNTGIEILPNCIVSLCNLQTLDIHACYKLRQLPKDMRNLLNLQILDISKCCNLKDISPSMGHLTNLRVLPMYIVSRKNGNGINELGTLKMLRGHLKIKNLDSVINATEASKADLKSKTGLRSLKLSWQADMDGSITPSSVDGVLDKLEPCLNLRELSMKSYPGTNFPIWMRNNTGPSSSLFPHLWKIRLDNFKTCEFLPSLGLLPSLKELSLLKLHGVKTMGTEFYGNSGTFPSLVQLEIYEMPNLEKWLTKLAGDRSDTRICFPCLKRLTIWDCQVLEVEPFFPPSLESLIVECSEKLLSAETLQGLSNLKSIKFNGPISSAIHGLQHLSALESLRIEFCDNLNCMPESLVQQHFPSFQTLQLVYNKNFASFGEGQVQEPPPSLFSNLHHLEIEGSHALVALPKWLGNLSFLETLILSDCPNLETLPNTFPTSLQKLHITRCSHLYRLYQREIGEKWHEISHIPDIVITAT